MSKKIAVVLASILSFMAVSSDTACVRAGEASPRSAQAQEAFDGWYSAQMHAPASGRWVTKARVNPAKGDLFMRLGEDPAKLAKGLDETSWAYSDKSVPLSVRYIAATHTATIAAIADGSDVYFDLLPTRARMIAWIKAHGRFTAATTRQKGEVKVVLTFRPPRPGPHGKRNSENAGGPVRIVATFDQPKGLLRTITVRKKDGSTVSGRLRYHTKPIKEWHDLICKHLKITGAMGKSAGGGTSPIADANNHGDGRPRSSAAAPDREVVRRR